jgi:XisI protein
MENIAQYRVAIKHILQQEAESHPERTDVEVCLVCDNVNLHYQLLYLGWQSNNRVFAPIVHIRIRHNKIWIEQDGTEEGIANQLIKAGVPQNEIVLAFYSPQKRVYTAFAAA